jgi:hypothetical protein
VKGLCKESTTVLQDLFRSGLSADDKDALPL